MAALIDSPESQALLAQALQTCAAERIHQIGTIQSVGVLVAVDETDLTIRMVSENLRDLFRLTAKKAIGQPFSALIGAAQEEKFRKLAAQEILPGGLICSLALKRKGRETTFDAHVYRADGLFVIEIEKDPGGDGDMFHSQFIPIRDSLWKLDAEQDVQRYSQAVAEEVRLLSGYDRVMVYRFDQNWDGEVIAESRIEGALSYLGNHFPAADIPPQARDLYTRNLVRLIVDVDGSAIPIASGASGTPPLDLSLSWLRSMSPVHVQYLRNMDVRSSLSISLVQNNQLWGLIACHHLSPKYVSLRTREMDEFIGHMVSLKLSNMESAERGKLQDQVKIILQRLTDAIRQTNNLDIVAKSCQDELLVLARATGAVISIAGVPHKVGLTPPNSTLEKLLDVLKTLPPAPIFCTDHLASLLPGEAFLRDIACGLMIAPLDHELSDFVLWFRPGIMRTLRWAGRPEKEVFQDEEGRYHVSPRQSFETWMETSHDKSLPWAKVEIDAAGTLSLALIEVMAQHALKSSDASYRQLAENSTDLIARLDQGGHVLFVSPASLALFGVEPAAMCGRRLRESILTT